MCFSTGSYSTTEYSAAPTTVATGDSEALQEAAEKRRNKAISSNGFSKNIVAGTSALTGTTSAASLKGTLG